MANNQWGPYFPQSQFEYGGQPTTPATPAQSLDFDDAARVPPPSAGETATHTWLPDPGDSDRLYAAMATGLADGVTACLAASVNGQPDVDGVTWCKHKHAAKHGHPGQDAPADPAGESVVYLWQVCHAGACTTQTLAPQAEAVALDVSCGNGQCCAVPHWLGSGKIVTAVATTGAASNACFAATTLTQGMMARWDPVIDHSQAVIAFVGGVLTPLP